MEWDTFPTSLPARTQTHIGGEKIWKVHVNVQIVLAVRMIGVLMKQKKMKAKAEMSINTTFCIKMKYQNAKKSGENIGRLINYVLDVASQQHEGYIVVFTKII